MTPMQRTLTTLSHNEPDRVPLYLLLTMQGAKEIGMSIRQYFSKPENVIEGQLRMREKYDNDCFYVFQYAAMDVEPWGGKVIFIEDGPPNAGQPIIFYPEKIKDLIAPDPLSSASIVRMLETIRRLKERTNGDVPIVGCVISPFSLPVMQMGFDKYIELMYDQPLLFDQLMTVNEEFCVRWANAQFDAGATVVTYFDPVSSTTITPPALSRKTGFPIARRTIKRFKGPALMHFAAGRCTPLLDELITLGVPAVGVSILDELAALKKACKGKLTLVGSLNGIEMRRWTLAETREKIKQQIAQAGEGGGFILSDNHGEIPYQVPVEVLLEISKTVKMWGQYPLNWITPTATLINETVSQQSDKISKQIQLADYAMAFDLLSSIGDAASEKNAVEQILSFYEVLTGAGVIAYLPIKGGNLQLLSSLAPNQMALRNQISSFASPYGINENGKGFHLEIFDSCERYGTLLVDEIRPKETIPHYFNLSINLAKVFALAISNAKKIEILSESQAELKMHKERLIELIDQKVNELREREKKLHDTSQQLMHSDKLASLGRLTASISHEFNNPLFGVLNVVEQTLEEEGLREEIKNLLRLAVKECNRMAEMIKKLREFYRPSSGASLPTDVHKTMDDVLLLMKKELQLSKIKLQKNYSPTLSRVAVVEDQLKQVFLNLLQNAADAITGENGAVSITIEMHEANVRVIIKDNGIGISEENLKKIFEPFFTTKAGKGTGLGLPVCYGIIKSFGGDILVESKLGAGSVFTVSLPVIPLS